MLFTPIRAERYRESSRLGDRIAPPYDVIDPERRRALAAQDPYNIVRVTLPEGTPQGYAAAAETLRAWREANVLVRDPEPGVYVLQQEFATPDGQTYVRRGVIGGLRPEGYEPGTVRPHERTHRGPKADRLALGQATRTAVEPIFVLARDERGHLRRRLDGVTRHEPAAVAELDGVRLSLWHVAGVQGREIAHAVGDGPLYIADGHHRYETATALREVVPAAARLPALVVPVTDPGLLVLATHRLVHGDPVPPDAMLADWDRDFTVEEREPELDPQMVLDALGSRAAAMVVFPDGRLVSLAARTEAVGELEITTIERAVIQPLVQRAGAEARVTYTADPGTLLRGLTQGAVAGVLVRPTPTKRVLAAADAGEVMPPKSTYFFPKVPSGLLVLPFDEDAAALGEDA